MIPYTMNDDFIAEAWNHISKQISILNIKALHR